MEKLSSKWFKGDFWAMSVKQIVASYKHKKGVKKPVAVERKMIKGKWYSRYYYKPMQPGEFWD